MDEYSECIRFVRDVLALTDELLEQMDVDEKDMKVFVPLRSLVDEAYQMSVAIVKDDADDQSA